MKHSRILQLTNAETNDGVEKSDIPSTDSKPQSIVDSSVDAADWTNPTSVATASLPSAISAVPSTSPEHSHTIATGPTAIHGPDDVVHSFFSGVQRIGRQQAQCACPWEREGELVGVCSVCATCKTGTISRRE